VQAQPVGYGLGGEVYIQTQPVGYGFDGEVLYATGPNGVLLTLAALDWPSQLWAVLMRGRPISVYWSAKPPIWYEHGLAWAGIEVRGRALAYDGFIIFVPPEDVDWARMVLGRMGAPLA
jgi:hypothetical protein